MAEQNELQILNKSDVSHTGHSSGKSQQDIPSIAAVINCSFNIL